MRQIKSRNNGDYRNRSKQACNEREAKKTIAGGMWAEVMLKVNQGGKTFQDFVKDGVLEANQNLFQIKRKSTKAL